MTIRRDLAELEERGLARRVRGGARAVGPRPFAERHHRATRAKSRIAAKLVELLPEAGAVAFDASSTVQRLAAIAAARDLTVLTNGPDTFLALQDRPGISSLLTGGRLDPTTGSLVGPLACRAAEQLSLHTFFASAAAVDPSGAREATLDEAEVKRCLADAADRVILAVDASKLASSATALAIRWDQIDLLVTELEPSDSRLSAYRALAEVR
jgi:DeoR family fructose operon transcriptional repressor